MKSLILTPCLLLMAALFCSFFSVPVQALDSIRVHYEMNVASDGPGKNIRSWPSIAYGDSTYLIVWQEGWNGKNGKSRIQALRIHASGLFLDSAGFEVAPCSSGVQERPRIAFVNGCFLVVWQDSRNGSDFDILGARISSDGSVLDENPLPLCTLSRTQVFPDVTADNKGFMVVWQGFQGTSNTTRLFASKVGTDGLITPQSLSLFRSNPRIAWNGKEYLLTFKNTAFMIQFARMDSNGTMLTTYQDVYGSKPAIESVCGIPGKGFAIVIHRAPPDYWGWGGPGAIMAYNISATGVLTTSTAQPCYQCTFTRYSNWLDYGQFFSAGALWPYGRSEVAYDGSHATAVWIRYRLGGATGIDFTNGAIVSGRLNADIPLEPKGVYVANSTESEINPALASNKNHQLLCVYEKRLSTGTTQIAARFITTADSALIAVEQTGHAVFSPSLRVFPNPFGSAVRFSVHAQKSSSPNTLLNLFSLDGKRIASLSANQIRSGTLEYLWQPRSLAAGVYVARIQFDGKTLEKKILLTR